VAVAGSSLLVGCGEDEYQKTGKIGSTLKLMGTFKTYKSTDEPTKAPAYDSTNKQFTCTVNIKCTTKKVPLYVTNECFELTVTHDKTEKNYAKQYITITDPEFDLKESEDAKDFKLTITGVTIADGDKVELKYWPRIQASSGNSGYTRAFCTWKMVAKAGTSGSGIVGVAVVSAIFAQPDIPAATRALKTAVRAALEL